MGDGGNGSQGQKVVGDAPNGPTGIFYVDIVHNQKIQYKLRLGEGEGKRQEGMGQGRKGWQGKKKRDGKGGRDGKGRKEDIKREEKGKGGGGISPHGHF